jgi:hypothetical protein
VTELENIVKRESWNLEPKLNANYAAFKRGFFNVFGVSWIGTKSFEVFANIPKSKLLRAKRLCPYPLESYNKGLSIPVTENLKPKRLIPLLQLAYDSFGGEAS